MAKFVIKRSDLPVGPQGQPGANGRDGLNGRNGNDGQIGFPGNPGKDGVNGSPGRDGLNGLNGLDGQHGKDGLGLHWRGPWSAETQYSQQDVVEFRGSSYVATAENRNARPPEQPWQIIAARGQQGEGGGGLSLQLPKPAQIYVGNAKGEPVPVTMSGDATIDVNGVVTVSGGGGGTGDVVGPASATDGDFAVYDGTTGKLIKDTGKSAASFDPAGAASAALTTAEAYADSGDDTTLAAAEAYTDAHAVTTTGSPVSGNLTKFSGAGSITNGDLSGDVTTSGALTTTIKTSLALPGSPTTTTQSTGDNSTKLATTAYVTTAIANAVAAVNPAVAVDVATTSAANTSGLTYNNGVSGVGATLTGAVNTALTVDGVTFNTLGQRLLVKNDTQSPSGAFNGVYSVTQLQTAILPPVLTRALDYDQASDINNTGAIPVKSGTVNALTSWLLTSLVTTVGTDPLTYVQFSFSPVSAANPTATAGPTAVNGTATTYMRSDAAPAVQKGSNSQFGVVEGDGSTVTIVAGVVSTTPDVAASRDDLDLMFFGGGTDGDVTISSGTTLLTKDAFYHNLTISGTGKLNTNGWRVYVQGTLDLTNAPAGAIVALSNLGTSLNGGTAAGSGGGAAGATTSTTNTVGTGVSGGTGGSGGTGAGTQAGAIGASGNQIPNTAGAGGKGGNVGATAGGASRGGSTGSFAVSDVRKLTDSLYVIQNTTVQYVKNGPGAPGGSSGAGDGTGSGGGGGGGGATPGIIWIAARTIARATATTTARAVNVDGGNGGTGSVGTGGTNRGGGGGGGGAPGGWLYVIYRLLTGTAATSIFSATGGNGGTGGAGTGTGGGGDGGASGSRGRIDLYCLATGSWTHSEADTTSVAGGAASGTTGGTGATANTQFLTL